MHGRGGVCVAGGHALQETCVAGGHAWQGTWVAGGKACVAGGMRDTHTPQQILRDTVNEQAVRILLECILVVINFFVFKKVNASNREYSFYLRINAIPEKNTHLDWA